MLWLCVGLVGWLVSVRSRLGINLACRNSIGAIFPGIPGDYCLAPLGYPVNRIGLAMLRKGTDRTGLVCRRHDIIVYD